MVYPLLLVIKDKQMQGLFSVRNLFWVRDKIWLCVGM